MWTVALWNLRSGGIAVVVYRAGLWSDAGYRLRTARVATRVWIAAVARRLAADDGCWFCGLSNAFGG